MFHHQKETAYHCKPERPDPVYARKLQELIGGPWAEMSVMTAYLFQGGNCRGPRRVLAVHRTQPPERLHELLVPDLDEEVVRHGRRVIAATFRA